MFYPKKSQRSKRLALVIGNSNYENLAVIPNAAKDAGAIQETLVSLGFEVTLGVNQDKRQILECITKIRYSWKHEASEIVVYYSGHGLSNDGKVYLCPVDATEVDIDLIDENFLGVEVILKLLLKYRGDDKFPIIIILDCCRSTSETIGIDDYDRGDPLRGVRGDNSHPKTNIAILYSTTDGHIASDGYGNSNHSPYTQTLLENMVKSYTIEQIQYELMRSPGCSRELGTKQVPWIYQNLYKPYKFCVTTPAVVPREFSAVLSNTGDPVKNPFNGLPPKNFGFIDRPKITLQMRAALGERSSSGESNILVLRGLGGMGKTQLMLHYCYLCRAAYNFTFWLEADGWVTTLDSFRRLAINLGLDETSAKEKCSDEKIINWVRDWLEKRTGWLLLLNNADETTCARIFNFLPRIGDIIMTTREHVSSKKARIITVGKMDENEALSLLFGTSDIDSVDHKSSRYRNAKEIVSELDSMALAVDLARAYIEYMSISFQGYLNMLRTQWDILFSHQDKDNSYQYSHSLKTVWQLSFERIRTQSPLAAELLDACVFLQPELIPVSLFKRQYSVLTRSSDLSSLTSSETHEKVLRAVQEAIAVLVKFSFVSRTLDEDINNEDPASDVLTIHRLVQKVIYDAMSNEQKIRLAFNIASALNNEIDFSDSYASFTRTIMNMYLPHIRHFAKVLSNGQRALMSEDFYRLLLHTVNYLFDNGVYFGTEQLAKLTVSISESIHGPENSSMATSLNNLALLYHNQGNYIKAEPLYQRTLAIRELVLGPEHPQTAMSLNNLALLYYDQGNYTKAEPLYQRALAISEKVQGPEHPEMATSLNNLALLYYDQGNYTKAEPLYRRALAIREGVLGPDHPETANSLSNLALLYHDQENCTKAEPLYRRALAIREKVLGPEHPETATSLSNLALLYHDQGNYTKAEPLYQRALVISEKAQGPEHPEMATSLNNLALLHYDQGNCIKAELLYQRALEISEKAQGPEHPKTATFLNNLALLYCNQGDYDKAEPLYQRALAIREKVLSPEHPETTTSLSGLALLYHDQGNYTKAEPLYRRALTIREKVLGPEHPETITSLSNLALLYHDRGDHTKAEPLYQRALAIREKVLGPEHPEIATSLSDLALLYQDQKDYTKAEPLYKRALTICEKVLGPEHPNTLISWDNLATLYNDQNDYGIIELREDRVILQGV